jgi:hypothetical protein
VGRASSPRADRSGGVWTVAAFGLRVFNRAQRHVTKAVGKETDVIPSAFEGNSPAARDGSSYFGNSNPVLFDYKAT